MTSAASRHYYKQSRRKYMNNYMSLSYLLDHFEEIESVQPVIHTRLSMHITFYGEPPRITLRSVWDTAVQIKDEECEARSKMDEALLLS